MSEKQKVSSEQSVQVGWLDGQAFPVELHEKGSEHVCVPPSDSKDRRAAVLKRPGQSPGTLNISARSMRVS